jgi:hypothetical protein
MARPIGMWSDGEETFPSGGTGYGGQVILLVPRTYEDGEECSETSEYKIQNPGITQEKEYNRLFLAYICTTISEYQINTNKCAGMLLVCAI